MDSRANKKNERQCADSGKGYAGPEPPEPPAGRGRPRGTRIALLCRRFRLSLWWFFSSVRLGRARPGTLESQTRSKIGDGARALLGAYCQASVDRGEEPVRITAGA